MLPAGFETSMPTSERLQTHAIAIGSLFTVSLYITKVTYKFRPYMDHHQEGT
jgi:hypothetical protein